MIRTGQEGYTLVELLVAMTVGLIVVFGAFTLISSAGPLAATTRGRVDATQRGRSALDQMLVQLRSQTCLDSARVPVTLAKEDEVLFYSNFGDETTLPQQRRLRFANGEVIEEMWQASGSPPAWDWPTTPTRTRSVATGLAQQGGTAFFRFYAFTTTAPVEPTRELVPPTTGLSAADLADVVRVDVTFASRSSGDGARAKDVPFEGSALVRTASAQSPTAGPGCR
jgi:prepilin-type N-terminal cleavage/methylation domain-containing protein